MGKFFDLEPPSKTWILINPLGNASEGARTWLRAATRLESSWKGNLYSWCWSWWKGPGTQARMDHILSSSPSFLLSFLKYSPLFSTILLLYSITLSPLQKIENLKKKKKGFISIIPLVCVGMSFYLFVKEASVFQWSLANLEFSRYWTKLSVGGVKPACDFLKKKRVGV